LPLSWRETSRHTSQPAEPGLRPIVSSQVRLDRGLIAIRARENEFLQNDRLAVRRGPISQNSPISRVDLHRRKIGVARIAVPDTPGSKISHDASRSRVSGLRDHVTHFATHRFAISS